MELTKHFPDGFDFFDLGKLKSATAVKEMAMPKLLVSFSFSGEENGTCLVWFEQTPYDHSMAMELANILTSKFVNNICDDGGLLIEMSPPRIVDAEEKLFQKLSQYTLKDAEGVHRGRSYVFSGGNERMKINLIYIESQRGTA